MAVSKKVQSKAKPRKREIPVQVIEPEKPAVDMDVENNLDPEEEKMLDWILKAVVWFVLGWLGLSVLLVIGGYFGLWK